MNDFWYGYIAAITIFIALFVVGITIASWGPRYDCYAVRNTVLEKIQECEKDPDTKQYDCAELIKSIYCEEKE